MSAPKRKARVKSQPVSGRAERRLKESQKARTRKMLFFGGALVIALVVAIGLILLNQDDGDDESANLPAIVAANSVDASIPSNGRVLGDPNAPVTLLEYSDYQCPFCKAFNDNFVPRIIADYVKTGKVKLEYHPMSFIDDQSRSGESDMPAEAAACAGDQGKYWLMQETIFANQSGENEGAFSKSRLKTMAELAGLDMEQFNSCFDKGTYKADVQTLQAEAVRAGVNSTPTLFLNGVRIDFTGKYEDLQAEIEAALAA